MQPPISRFFNTQLAEPAQVASGSGPTTRPVRVIFDREGEIMGIGAEGRKISAYLPTSDTTGIRRGDTLTHDAITYEIVGINPLDDGKITELDLKE